MELLSESVVPWLDKVILQDRRLVAIPEGEPVGTRPTFKNEITQSDFKSFVLNANQRPIDFQVSQMMLAIKQLMDVCEKQQIMIESLQAAMKNQFDHKPPVVY